MSMANGFAETSDLVDPTIEIDVNFDEEQLTSDEWLHMMQQEKSH